MPNVLLTQKCVRSCPYCFARKHMTDASPDDVISWEDLIYLADFLQLSGERRFSILGGEPTIHPDFNNMVLYLLEREFHVTVFTSGIMADKKLIEAEKLFAEVPPGVLGFVVNLNDPAKTKTPMAELESAKRFMGAFGNKIIPGFNIYRTDFELEFLFQYINEFNLQRSIRLGLTHPIVGKRNRFITLADIAVIIERLFSYTSLFERLRIKPGLDCGFPMCRFSDAQLAWLYRNTGGHYDFGCGPVIDIGPDMAVWSCFPLSSFQKKQIYEFNNLQEVHEYYRNIHQKIKVEAGGIYRECDECRYRRDNTCGGGCLAHNLNRFQSEERVRMQEVYQ